MNTDKPNEPTAISVDDAVATLVAEAECHEKEHNADFCVDTRVSLVVFVMLHLGLELRDLGEIAEGYVAMVAGIDDEGEGEPQQWPDVVGEGDEHQ